MGKKRTRKGEISDGVTQQLKCFVPVGSEGLFDDSGLTEVGAVCCDDCEGVWEGENITFDETVSGEYLVTSAVRQKRKRERWKGNEPMSFIE